MAGRPSYTPFFTILLQQCVNGIDPRNHGEHSRVHAREIVRARSSNVVVRHTGDDSTIGKYVRDRLWKFRIQSWADKWKDEVRELGDSRPDEDEPSYKSREPDAIKQPNRRERI